MEFTDFNITQKRKAKTSGYGRGKSTKDSVKRCAGYGDISYIASVFFMSGYGDGNSTGDGLGDYSGVSSEDEVR